jgi:hypothetical protein
MGLAKWRLLYHGVKYAYGNRTKPIQRPHEVKWHPSLRFRRVPHHFRQSKSNCIDTDLEPDSVEIRAFIVVKVTLM